MNTNLSGVIRVLAYRGVKCRSNKYDVSDILVAGSVKLESLKGVAFRGLFIDAVRRLTFCGDRRCHPNDPISKVFAESCCVLIGINDPQTVVHRDGPFRVEGMRKASPWLQARGRHFVGLSIESGRF